MIQVMQGSWICGIYSSYHNLNTMPKLNKQKEWKQQYLLLDEVSQKSPKKVLDRFFDGFHLDEAREELWNWLVTALSKDEGLYDDAQNRIILISFYEHLSNLIEAAWIIRGRNNSK